MNELIIFFFSCWVEIPEMPTGYCYEGEVGDIVSISFCEEPAPKWRSVRL